MFLHFVEGQMLSQGTLRGVDHLQGSPLTVCPWRQGNEKQWFSLYWKTIICDNYHRCAWGDTKAVQTHFPRRDCNHVPPKQYDLQACWWRNEIPRRSFVSKNEIPRRNVERDHPTLAKEYLIAGFKHVLFFKLFPLLRMMIPTHNEYEQTWIHE